jgi:hypothetical protein
MIKYLVTVLLMLSCISPIQERINSQDVNRIEILNKTTNHFIADKISFIDRTQIDRVVGEINRMQLIDSSVDTKDSFGYYDLEIELKDGSIRTFWIIYTVYNGIIVHGTDKWGVMNQSYKNDRLELLALWLFQPGNTPH